MDIQKRVDLYNQGYWEIPEGLDTSNFDFDWRPDPYDRPYIHQFGTQWQKTGGPRFVIPENEGIKYQSHQKATRLPDATSRNWRPLRSNISMDYSWHPCDTDPPYIYIFGNQWYDVHTMPTIQYRVKGATEKKYITDITARLDPCMDRWIVPEDIKDDFDYSWVPHPHEPPLIWQFGTQHQRNGGPQYVADNAIGKKYTDILKATKLPNENRHWRPLKAGITFDYSWHPDEDDPPYIYVFGNQHYGPEIMPTVLYRAKGATEKKYMTNQHAILPVDYESYEKITNLPIDFDYSWVPNPNDPPYLYVFGNQHYDSIEMPTLLYKTKGATTPKYMTDIKATIVPDMDKWIVPDDIEEGFDYSWIPDPKEPPYIWQFGTQWQKTGGPAYIATGATEVKYVDSIKAIKKENRKNWRIIESIQEDSFDFSWHPDSTEEPYVYVFGNEYYKPEDMPTITYSVKGAKIQKPCTDIVPKLKDFETVVYEDSLFDAVMKNVFNSKYIHFSPNKTTISTDILTNSNDKFYIHVFNGTEAIVHREAKQYLYDKITDYPDIKYHIEGVDPEPLDIIFISNGEDVAEENFKHLEKLTKGLPNRLLRVTNVNGRVASQHAAANIASTPWYFLINGKLRVDENFDFSWQPNRLKRAQHYIFRAKNPLNGLIYGHMATVANNKRLTLLTKGTGLDFTMESPHEVVDILSGEAVFTSDWDIWRTAFRECIKLCVAKDEESKRRLDIWKTVGESKKGAIDAIDFYNEVNGDMNELMKSYDWVWLKDRYNLMR